MTRHNGAPGPLTLATMQPPRPTAIEFLLARFAEDLAEAQHVPGGQRAVYECTKNYLLLDLHSGAHVCHNGTGAGQSYGEWDDPCPTIVTLTIPYTDHPDCRDTWRGWVAL